MFTFLGKILFNLPITDILYTYVLGKTKNLNSINLKHNDFKFCVEFPVKAFKKKMKISSYQSYERSRIAGKKK